ncbi:hypothetical protein [Pandoravirus japonicus]|uniref:Uncharacterized protein n=1 Tax=Pandoravirus japonicus TaxID=2823154 RepID=A0A811BNX5_9VIRU|nr:hypothetical protein [Pandoravirus japonicus]
MGMMYTNGPTKGAQAPAPSTAKGAAILFDVWAMAATTGRRPSKTGLPTVQTDARRLYAESSVCPHDAHRK